MAASISGSGARICYPSAPRGTRRRAAAVISVRSSLATSSAATRNPSSGMRMIGRQWTEIQGARDWDGLLSPLDGALRGELVRYGEFVRAAYASFDFDGGAAPWSYGSCRFPIGSLLRRSGLPETGYRVTRLLHAASNYIGYVAVCDDEDEIERLGRRDVVVAFRGTATCSEWVHNFKSSLTHIPSSHGEEEAMVESGFWRLFTTPGKAHDSLQQQVRGEVGRIVGEYGGDGMPPLSVTVTGHSLGAALAVLAAYEITTAAAASSDEAAAPPIMVTAVSFGGPRVGNAAFRRRLEESGGKVLRVVNSNDIVTKVPGFAADDGDCGDVPAAARRKTRVARWLVSKMGWAYSDVGCELRLCNEGTARNVVASHDLDLYLKLVAACTD
uniref:Fungal lipase-type domain-containing protein n=1 Tax=Leersia perrieri TaxID=77586 RepID=A0A0D9XP07_9ORYZ